MRRYTLISILLVLIAGSFACSSSQDGPQPTDGTPVPRTSPSPTSTATATPSVTPTATPVPKPSPTPTATVVPTPPEDEARVEAFFEEFISISYEASFDMPNEFTESDYPVSATVDGWMTIRAEGGSSQFFTKIAMTEPIERSIEVVSRPGTFDMYLSDLDANKWYSVPEISSTADSGPLEDIHLLWSLGMAFSALPRADMQQVPEGYIWKIEDPTYGSSVVTYDQAYKLETFVHTAPDGKEILRVRFFDLNKPHDLVPYEEVEELLPATYWEPE